MLTYLIFMAPAILLALWAQAKVTSTFHRFAKVPTRSGLSGADVARQSSVGRQTDDVARRTDVGQSTVYGRRHLTDLGTGEHKTDHREAYDLVVARAVAPLRVLAEYMLPLARVGGWAVALKGAGALEEVAEAAHAMHVLGGLPPRVQPYTLPGLDHPRAAVVIPRTEIDNMPRTSRSIREWVCSRGRGRDG